MHVTPLSEGDAPRAPVRVLWLVKGLGAGGAEHLLVSLAAAHDPAAVHIETAFALSGKTQLVAALQAEGVKVHPLGVHRLRDPRWVWRLRRLMAAGHFDIVHGHSPAVLAVARLLSRTLPRATRPLTMSTEHNLWASHGRLTRAANRTTYGLDAAHLAVAKPIVAALPRRAAAATQVVIHGPDPARLDAARSADRRVVRASFDLEPDHLLAVNVANLRVTKGHDTLIEAARLLATSGVGVTFLFVGQGPLEAEIRHAARDVASVRVVGHRSDAPDIIAASDLFVLASRHEGLPIALLEAMALGAAVVATRVGGVPDVVRDGVDGVLVDPDDAPGLAAAIARLAADPAERARLATAAGARVAHYDIVGAARRSEEIYAAVAQRRAGPTRG